ncbi:hypothetical protein [Ruminococcus flavefaciens]|uniref:hypothetical protein n=1 Tax=Ruminococcus flavefaciens TaxID=1265 RepID=UPI0004669CBF|nr:hypothetical protein [Ruminococcus flavefaciens]
MKRSTLKLTLAFMLAVCTLTGCGKDSSESKNDNRNNSSSAAVTTASEVSGSALAAATTADDKTEAETTQTETALPEKTEAPQSDKTDVTSADQSEGSSDAVTEAQALEAVKNYCFTKNPNLKNMVDSDEYTIYWNASVNDANEIVVLFRSYTAAQIRYYIDPISGETYVTELVPGIIDEEQRTEESFNIRDYLG